MPETVIIVSLAIGMTVAAGLFLGLRKLLRELRALLREDRN